jgi:hypothetical protein
MSADEMPKEFLGVEYDKLKSEQAQRIGFRDNMLFVHLAAVGSVASWVLTNLDKPNVVYALLVIPWICLILGWTYTVNDHAVSRIGKYIRLVVDKRASKIVGLEPVEVIENSGEKIGVCPT